MKNYLPILNVVDIVQQNDGTAIITFDISNEFKDWFKQTYNLKRFSSKRFEKCMIEALENALKEIDEKEK